MDIVWDESIAHSEWHAMKVKLSNTQHPIHSDPDCGNIISVWFDQLNKRNLNTFFDTVQNTLIKSLFDHRDEQNFLQHSMEFSISLWPRLMQNRSLDFWCNCNKMEKFIRTKFHRIMPNKNTFKKDMELTGKNIEEKIADPSTWNEWQAPTIGL